MNGITVSAPEYSFPLNLDDFSSMTRYRSTPGQIVYRVDGSALDIAQNSAFRLEKRGTEDFPNIAIQVGSNVADTISCAHRSLASLARHPRPDGCIARK
ncbi:MAG: hypothetical protein AB7T01_02070 [Acidithiobacillus sp.]